MAPFPPDTPTSFKNWYLKSFPPQMTLADIENISALFKAQAISADFGKRSSIGGMCM
jgi:hypothetical protein